MQHPDRITATLEYLMESVGELGERVAKWEDIMKAMTAGKPCERCRLDGPESHAAPLSEPTLGDSTPKPERAKSGPQKPSQSRTRKASPKANRSTS
jgi:hypothetical protein